VNPTEFTDQRAPKNKKILNIAVLVILICLLSLNSDFRKAIQLVIHDSSQLVLLIKIAVIGGMAIVIISYLFFFKKIFTSFKVNEQGVSVGNKNIAWSDVKNWHMLGDSQDERTGLGSIKKTGGFDVVNPYFGMNIFVLKTKSGFINHTIRLQLSQDRANQFVQILQDHGLVRETKMRMNITNINPWFIIFFIVPFGLIALWLFIMTFLNR
jgi:hypothetical protein